MTAIDPSNLNSTAHLTFDDEFNTLNLWNGGSGTWDTDAAWDSPADNGYSLGSNGEQQWYINSNYAATSAFKPWTVGSGVLNITGSVAPASVQPLINNYHYISGQLNTSKSYSQLYGYFEVSAKLPAGQGFWPAFWLLPENGSWPPELDVMESLGNKTSTYYTTVHFAADNQSIGQTINSGVDLSAGFHTYGVDWESDFITWYLDGKQVFQAATPSDMHSPMYMLLNLALGGYWPGNVDSTTNLSNPMQVDWVRAYQSGPTSTTVGTVGASGGSGSTLTAAGDGAVTLTGGAGDDTLIANHGADTLAGGGGIDTFKFPVIPWAIGHVSDFTPGTDKIDLSGLFKSFGYTGSNPVLDGWLILASDYHGGSYVEFNPHDGSNSGYPYVIADLDGVSISSLVADRDVIYAASGTTTTTPTTTTSTGGLTLTAPNDGGTTLTGGVNNDTLIASHGADTLTGGGGADTFQFGVIPWAAGHVTDFTPGTDKIDLSGLFRTFGYAGSNPVLDGWLSVAGDGHGGTAIYFNPHNGSNNGNAYRVTDLNGVARSTFVASRDVITSSTTTVTTPPPTTGSGVTVTAPNDNGTKLTGGAGADTLVASHGADTLTGGAGVDSFQFGVIPWAAGHVTDFTPGTDKLDLSGLFKGYGYTGSNPVADGWLAIGGDGHGGADVYFNPHNGSNNGYPFLITDLDGVSPSSVVATRDVISASSGNTTTTTPTPPPTTPVTSTTTGLTLTAPNDNGSILTGGSGADTLLASHGADTLTGGAGADTFRFRVLPWAAGHVTDFTPGTDVLDLRPLFKAAGYGGSNPTSDGWLSFSSDGHGGTDVYFNPHNGSNSGYPFLITDLDHVAPTSLQPSHDLLFH